MARECGTSKAAKGKRRSKVNYTYIIMRYNNFLYVYNYVLLFVYFYNICVVVITYFTFCVICVANGQTDTIGRPLNQMWTLSIGANVDIKLILNVYRCTCQTSHATKLHHLGLGFTITPPILPTYIAYIRHSKHRWRYNHCRHYCPPLKDGLNATAPIRRLS